MPDEARRLDPVYPPPAWGTVALIERSLVLLLVLGLLVGVAAVLKPFVSAILFGAILAIAAWPLRQALVRRGLRGGWAAMLLLLLSAVVIAVPVLVMAPILTDQLLRGMEGVQAYFATVPEQPSWLKGIPFLGARLGRIWSELVRAEGNLTTALAPYADTVRATLLAAARGLADSVVQIVLSLIVATMFWASGDALARELHHIFRRLGGTTGESLVDAAAGAVRSVAYGVIGTAVIQAVILTFGLAVAHVPGAATLGFIGLLLAISQIGGPLLVLIWGGAAWWLVGQDHAAWAVFMVVWGLLVSTIDNILKPWLIGLGVDMPMTLTILGVFGGFVAFGFLGLFIGPTLVALAFTLLRAWLASSPPVVEEVT
jgi:predicted PurR-regulated permease PerM